MAAGRPAPEDAGAACGEAGLLVQRLRSMPSWELLCMHGAGAGATDAGILTRAEMKGPLGFRRLAMQVQQMGLTEVQGIALNKSLDALDLAGALQGYDNDAVLEALRERGLCTPAAAEGAPAPAASPMHPEEDQTAVRASPGKAAPSAGPAAMPPARALPAGAGGGGPEALPLETLRALEDALRFDPVDLCLNDLELGVTGCRLLCKELRHRHGVQMIRLRGNLVGDAGLGLLAPALRHAPRLHSLWLENNRFGEDGVAALAAEAQHLGGLQRLDLTSNRIDDAGAAALARAFRHLPGLKALWLDGNHITDAGAQALAEALPLLSQLQLLFLQRNKMTDEGRDMLARAFSEHPPKRLTALHGITLSRHLQAMDLPEALSTTSNKSILRALRARGPHSSRARMPPPPPAREAWHVVTAPMPRRLLP